MRAVPLLVVLLCSLTVSATPEMSLTTEPMTSVIASADDDANYQALQQQADLARDLLAQAQGRQLAALAVN